MRVRSSTYAVPMSSSVATLRRHQGAVPLDQAEARDRSVRRRISAAWGLLYLDTLTFVTGVSILPIPSKVGKGLTQGALPLAILLLLSVNPKVKVRPNVFLCLVSLLVVDTLITVLQPQHIGTVYRTFRFAEFVGALWLLTPWWAGATCCFSGAIFAGSTLGSARCSSAS